MIEKKSREILFVLTKNSPTIVHIVLFHLYLPKWDVSPQAKGKCFNLMCVLSIKTRENFDRWIKDRECCLKKIPWLITKKHFHNFSNPASL